MFTPRSLLVLLVLLLAASGARAQAERSVGEAEAAVPSLSFAVSRAIQSTAYLQDALLLSTAQARALRTETILEIRALALALNPAQAQSAERYHLRTVARMLTASQFGNYCQLRRLAAGADSLPGSRFAALNLAGPDDL